jgi:hypothetical protein
MLETKPNIKPARPSGYVPTALNRSNKDKNAIKSSLKSPHR